MKTTLSIVPYQFLPPTNGGHWGIINCEETLNRITNNHVLATQDNIADSKYNWPLHAEITSSKLRYIPYQITKNISNTAQKIDADFVFLHHPYLFSSAYKATQKLNIPLYIRSHNIEALRFKELNKKWWPLLAKYEKYSYQKAQHVFFVTEEDKDWAINNYQLSPSQCTVFPYGVTGNNLGNCTQEEKDKIAAQYQLDLSLKWGYFMGQLSYQPNEDGVKFILNHIIPQLEQQQIKIQLLILGKGLSDELQTQIKQTEYPIHYLGFVPELEPVIKCCDIMLNPTLSGGGVKTKLLESIAMGKTVISTENGAIGVEKSLCEKKLFISPDHQWNTFTQSIISQINQPAIDTPEAFYNHYAPESIAKRIEHLF